MYLYIYIHVYAGGIFTVQQNAQICAMTYCCVVQTWGGARWGGATTFNIALAHAHTHAMLRFCTFFSMLRCAQMGWGGEGWGGVGWGNNVQLHLHTHTHVMLRFCTFFSMLHCAHVMGWGGVHGGVTGAHTRHATLLHVLLTVAYTRHAIRFCTFVSLLRTHVMLRTSCTHVMLRFCTFFSMLHFCRHTSWGTLRWGGATIFNCTVHTHTHMSCYASARNVCHCMRIYIMLRYLHLRLIVTHTRSWGGTSRSQIFFTCCAFVTFCSLLHIHLDVCIESARFSCCTQCSHTRQGVRFWRWIKKCCTRVILRSFQWRWETQRDLLKTTAMYNYQATALTLKTRGPQKRKHVLMHVAANVKPSLSGTLF